MRGNGAANNAYYPKPQGINPQRPSKGGANMKSGG